MFYYCEKIKTLLEAGIPQDRVNYYILGSAENIPQEVAERGFIQIVPTTSTTNIADNTKDETIGSIDVIVGVLIRELWNGSAYDNAHFIEVGDIMEGKDANGNLKSDTVKAILRKNINSLGLNQSELIADYSDQRDESYIYSAKFTLQIYEQNIR